MFGRHREREYDDDNGETVANMNVEGMPWYKPPSPEGEQEPPPRLTGRETFSLIVNAMLAGLAIALIFIAAAALLILFCTTVWLR